MFYIMYVQNKCGKLLVALLAEDKTVKADFFAAYNFTVHQCVIDCPVF